MSVQNCPQAVKTHQDNFQNDFIDSKQETLNKLQKVRDAVGLLGKAIKNPTRSSNAVFTLFRGVANLFSGNIFSGAALTSLGGIELYLVFSQNQTANMKELLDDAGAGLSMIQNLEKENGKTLESLQDNLRIVNKEIASLSSKLENVKNIAVNGNAELAKLKEEARAKYETALVSQTAALNKLNEVKASLENGSNILLEAKENILALQQKATEPASDTTEELNQQFEDFKTLADNALTSFSSAEKFFNNSSGLLKQGMDLIQRASQDQNAATEAAVKAMMTSENALNGVIVNLEHQKELDTVNETLDVVKDQLEEMKQRNQEKDAMLADVQENIQEAQEQIIFGLQSVILGGGLGACFGPMIGMPSCFSAPAGVALYHDLHNGGPVSKVAHVAYDVIGEKVIGKTPAQPQAPIVQTDHLSFAFDEKSSGWYGWAKGLPSRTQGTLKLSIDGKVILESRINFNRKKPMNVKDMEKLSVALEKILKEDPTKCDEVEALIHELKGTSVKRHKESQSLMSHKSVKTYFGECQRIIKKQRKLLAKS